jgi:hypothetical protein
LGQHTESLQALLLLLLLLLTRLQLLPPSNNTVKLLLFRKELRELPSFPLLPNSSVMSYGHRKPCFLTIGNGINGTGQILVTEKLWNLQRLSD